MEEEKLSVIVRGFRDASDDELRGGIVRRGYEKELARLLVRSLGREAAALFAVENSEIPDAEGVLTQVRGLAPSGASGARFAEYFSELYKKSFGSLRLGDMFVNEADEEGNSPSPGIAFVSGGSIDYAYKLFAEKLVFAEKPTPIHTQRLSAACDAVMGTEAGYAIIPIRSAADGKLRSFYRVIDGYDLKIASVCTIGTDENEMRYALCMRSYRPFSEMPGYVEIALPADGEEALAAAVAAKALGYTLLDMSSAPSERDGEIYSFTFAAKRDPLPLVLYMNLYHPRYTLTGLYDILSER